MKTYTSTLMLLLAGTLLAAAETTLTSPDGQLAVKVSITNQGAPVYRVERDGKVVLRDSKLGLVRDDADFSKNLKLLSASTPEKVQDTCELPGSKRLINHYSAMRQVMHLEHTGGGKPC